MNDEEAAPKAAPTPSRIAQSGLSARTDSSASRPSCASCRAGSSGAGATSTRRPASGRSRPTARRPAQARELHEPRDWGDLRAGRRRSSRPARRTGSGSRSQPPWVGVDLDEELPEAEQYAIASRSTATPRSRRPGPGYHVIVRADLNGRGRHPEGSASSRRDGSSTAPASTSPGRRRRSRSGRPSSRRCSRSTCRSR